MKDIKPIVIEQPLGGWTPDFSATGSRPVESRQLQGQPPQYTYATGVSLFRGNRVGHLSPGEAFDAITDASSKVNGSPLSSTVASNGNAFTILNTARTVWYVPGTDSIGTNSYDPTAGGTNHSGHTTMTGTYSDILSVKDQAATPTEYVLYSWQDNTDGDIGYMLKDGTGTNDNWFSRLTGSAALTKGYPNYMISGTSNADFYCTNGRYIASATITNASGLTSLSNAGNAKALDLGVGWVANGLAIYKNNLVISAYKENTYISGFSRSESRIYIWDTFSPSPNHIYNLNDNYAAAVVVMDSVIYVFTQGRNSTTKCKVYDGARFVTKFEYPTTIIGNAPTHGSVEIFQQAIHFANSTGVYSFDGEAFHMRSSISGGTGMLKNLATNVLYSGTATTIQKMNHSEYLTGAVWYSSLISMPYKANIKKIKVYFSQWATGSSVTLSLFRDYTATSVGGAADLLNTQITTTQLAVPTNGNSPTSYTITKVIPDISAFYMTVTFDHAAITNTAAIIRRIEIEWEPTDKM